MSATRHYHVCSGIPGYREPEGSYATLAEAREVLAGIKNEFLDWKWSAENPASFIVGGDVRRDAEVFIRDREATAWERSAYICDCTYPDCTPDAWEPGY